MDREEKILLVVYIFLVLLGLLFLVGGIYMLIDGLILAAKGIINVRSIGHIVVGSVFVLSSLLGGGNRASRRD